MKYWLMKSEPESYSWDDLIKEKETHWDGVRNYQARNNMREMKKGDLVLFYHSVSEKQIIGIAKVSQEAYQDPTTDDERWDVVNIAPMQKLKHPISLKDVKEDQLLSETKLVTQSRLSVLPLTKEQFERVLDLSQTIIAK